MHNVDMRGAQDRLRTRGSQGLWQEQRVQFARGHWRREERMGAVRSAGWWESVTVTWSSEPASESRSPLWRRALAAAADAIAPSITELVTARAARLLGRQRGTRAALPSSRRQLPGIARELPRSDRVT